MSGAPAEIDIIANDEASEVFNEVSSSFTAMSNNVSEASEQTNTAVAQSSQSFSQSALQMNSAAMSGAMLYMVINNVENAQTSLARANLTEEKAANSVTLAQQAYNLAVAKYGETSIQAHDAANKLNLAMETQQVDQERVAEANRNYNNTLMMSALTVIPAVINVISLASHATQIWESAQAALDVVMDANPIGLVVIAIAALVAGVIAAYTYCKPFCDVINEIGNIIGGAVLSAFNALKSAGDELWNGLNWVYSNILLPVANFFKEILVADLNVAMIPIRAFESAIGQIIDEVNGQLGTAGQQEFDFIIPNTPVNLNFVQTDQQIQILWGNTSVFSGLLRAYKLKFTQSHAPSTTTFSN